MNVTKVSSWTTEKGAKVELHTKHLTSESRTTDWGEILTKNADYIIIEKVIVNNEKVFNTLISRITREGQNWLNVGEQVLNGKRTNMLVPLPANIELDVWGDYDARQEAKSVKRDAREIKRDTEMKAKIKSGYCPKCGSYCYGDCTAN